MRDRVAGWGFVAALTVSAACLSGMTTGMAAAQTPAPAGGSSMDGMAGMKMDSKETAAAPAGPMIISFNGKTETWTASTLAALPHVTVSVYNGHAKANQSYSGVPLMTLLSRLGVAEAPKGKDYLLYLVASGSDGYGVAYSIGEVTPAVHESTVIVADSMDGSPIAASSGPLQLVAAGEKIPARWVRNLVSIRVQAAQ